MSEYFLMHKFTNKLINETSPYLLQHAHNPVNWYPWGEEALEKSIKENKPILVSIGYSACHWCHVMEKESFENEATAQIMNEHFINIKIDREERPDLDHLYMDAVQAMTGSGGWPLNVFLTPERKPFYGGTYFPPIRAFNRTSWQEILLGISEAFRERRNEIESQAENLTAHIAQSNLFGIKTQEEKDFFSKEKINEVFQNIMKSADKDWGGFSRAPKFPQTFIIQFLIRYNYITGNKDALKQAILSIDKMIDGGIYDHVGGGLARYSTDTEWLVPHFEKMLYDNALLVSVLSEAFQLTGNKKYKEVIDETIHFIQSEMMNDEGGFYSALDADSEGEEGKFYVWDHRDVKNILQEDADIFCEFFDISSKGNWIEKPGSEIGKNILRRKKEIELFATDKNISIEYLTSIIKKGKEILFENRKQRTRPQTDDKSLLSWNALMNTALTKAYAATGNEKYRELALLNMNFLLDRFSKGSTGEFYHCWKSGLPKQPAFLDDYAYLVQALIHLQEVTGETKYLDKAKEITTHVIEHFSDTGSPFFFFSSDKQQDILVRKIDLYDGAQPSGNAIMAGNLYRLGLYYDIQAWREKSLSAINTMGNIITRYPISFGIWGCLLLEITNGVNEIAIVGKNFRNMLQAVVREFIPHKIIMAAVDGNNPFPLLNGKKGGPEGSIYLCRNYTCKNPVNSVVELLSFIRHK